MITADEVRARILKDFKNDPRYFTSDSQPIVPGLRVWSLRHGVWATVLHENYMHEGYRQPFDHAFNGAFRVKLENSSNRNLTGSEMSTVEP